MIKKIGITNFKSLKKNELCLTNLNLLAGLNGMGKSSLLQVLLILKQSQSLGSLFTLTLNGSLTSVGKGKDVLYEFATEERIDFVFEIAGYKPVQLTYAYNPAADILFLGKGDEQIQIENNRIIFNTLKDLQYLCAERLGPQSIYETSTASVTEHNLGTRGEYSAHYLHLYGNKYKVPQQLKHAQTGDLTLLNQVNGWLGEISPGVKLNIIEVPHIDQLLMNYQFEMVNTRTTAYKPQNVGFGISYALPIIVALLTAQPHKIIIIENPESHIHPRGQAELGKLMALAAANGAQLFIETHSDHIINGTRVAVKEQLIPGEQVNIAYFDKVTTSTEQYTRITNLKVDNKGELSDYPENFLDEWNNQLLRLL